MGKSDNASEFLDLYRKLEGCIREHYGVPEKHGPVAWLGRNPGRAFRSVAGALKYCAEVRICSRTRRASMVTTPLSRATRC